MKFQQIWRNAYRQNEAYWSEQFATAQSEARWLLCLIIVQSFLFLAVIFYIHRNDDHPGEESPQTFTITLGNKTFRTGMSEFETTVESVVDEVKLLHEHKVNVYIKMPAEGDGVMDFQIGPARIEENSL